MINNYTTFLNKTEIDFSATNYKFLESENVGANRILKGCLFVGENASGKTKILEAIRFLLDILFDNKENDFLFKKSFYSEKETYEFEYTFLIDNQTIRYYIELDLTKIVAEELYINDQNILKRLGKNAQFTFEKEKNFDNVSEKLPFLRRIYFDTHFYDDKLLNKWFDYMKNSVYINCYTRKAHCYTDESLLIHDYLNEHDVSMINKFLEQINYPQTISYGKEKIDLKGKIQVVIDNNKKYVSFNKNGTNIYIPEIFESTGNVTLMQLIPSFLHAIKNDCIIVVDEFSSGFHNELEESFLKFFFHYAKNSQIFLASHSTNLLNNTILRPDQIYSVTFNPKKGSVLKRFSEEMPRESQNTEKMYLNGVFNGMPKYNKHFKD